MKKLKGIFATLTLASVVLFGSGSMLPVQADTGGPQGTQESKSKGPSTSSASQQELQYLLWLIIMWLLGWL